MHFPKKHFWNYFSGKKNQKNKKNTFANLQISHFCIICDLILMQNEQFLAS